MTLILKDEMVNILLQEIENSFDETYNKISNTVYMNGYNIVYRFCTSRQIKEKFEKITYVFTKVTYKKARKYNNMNTIDKIKYCEETNNMLGMCTYWKTYYGNNDKLKDIITQSWDKAEKLKHLHLIGCIINKNNLPSLTLGRKIGSFLYNIDEFKPLIFTPV